jgi:hypothetical protein
MTLKRTRFEEYIWECYFKFLNREGRYCNAKGKTFTAFESLNRNPEQVPELLWQKLIATHLKTHTKN